jgi:cobalamin biosynthesis protein CbiG
LNSAPSFFALAAPGNSWVAVDDAAGAEGAGVVGFWIWEAKGGRLANGTFATGRPTAAVGAGDEEDDDAAGGVVVAVAGFGGVFGGSAKVRPSGC